MTDVTTSAQVDPSITAAPDTHHEAARSLTSEAWGQLRRSWMFWVALALIAVFVTMAVFPQVFTRTDPNRAILKLGSTPPAPTSGSVGTCRATTSTPAPSTAPGPRSSSACSRPSSLPWWAS